MNSSGGGSVWHWSMMRQPHQQNSCCRNIAETLRMAEVLTMVAATSTIGAQKSHDCSRVIRLAACSKQTAWGFS